MPGAEPGRPGHYGACHGAALDAAKTRYAWLGKQVKRQCDGKRIYEQHADRSRELTASTTEPAAAEGLFVFTGNAPNQAPRRLIREDERQVEAEIHLLAPPAPIEYQLQAMLVAFANGNEA